MANKSFRCVAFLEPKDITQRRFWDFERSIGSSECGFHAKGLVGRALLPTTLGEGILKFGMTFSVGPDGGLSLRQVI
jgi:hypothetical protein